MLWNKTKIERMRILSEIPIQELKQLEQQLYRWGLNNIYGSQNRMPGRGQSAADAVLTVAKEASLMLKARENEWN